MGGESAGAATLWVKERKIGVGSCKGSGRTIRKTLDLPERMGQEGDEQLDGSGGGDGCESWTGDGAHLVERTIVEGLEEGARTTRVSGSRVTKRERGR